MNTLLVKALTDNTDEADEAAKGVNRIQLATYFSIGKYVSANTRQGVWGTGALEAISTRLRQLLPGLRGYSADSLKLMRIFYEEWKELDATSLKAEEEKDNSLITIHDLDSSEKKQISIRELQFINSAAFPIDDFLDSDVLPTLHQLCKRKPKLKIKTQATHCFEKMLF